MMMLYEVYSHEDLGNAIWSSRVGDAIEIREGDYGFIPVKLGVNYKFCEDASVVGILGLGISFGSSNWSAGSIVFNGTSINNPTIRADNIKMYYAYRQKLPFNSQLPHDATFLHPNGVLIRLLNEATANGFSIGDPNGLPCDYAEIFVPSYKFYDVEIADNYSSENIEKASLEIALRESIEKENLNANSPFGSNFDYLAFWAVNDFIREYARIFELNHIEGLSFSRFFMNLGHAIFYRMDESPVRTFESSLIEKFSNGTCMEKSSFLQGLLLETEDFSLLHYIDLNLKRLNYQAAIIGMYQLFESGFETSCMSNKWGYIESKTSDSVVKKNLAEMINARNWITHHRKLKTEHKTSSNSSEKNTLKTDWGAESFNQFQIFYRGKPWDWRSSLNMFVNGL
jgi:hypothetical protein